jgi:hypothetical protein
VCCSAGQLCLQLSLTLSWVQLSLSPDVVSHDVSAVMRGSLDVL